jgi:hypothetical protein
VIALRVVLAVAGLGAFAALAIAGRPGGFAVAGLLGLAGFVVAAGALVADLAPFVRVRAACSAASMPVALGIPLLARGSAWAPLVLAAALVGLQLPPLRVRRPWVRS